MSSSPLPTTPSRRKFLADAAMTSMAVGAGLLPLQPAFSWASDQDNPSETFLDQEYQPVSSPMFSGTGASVRRATAPSSDPINQYARERISSSVTPSSGFWAKPRELLLRRVETNEERRLVYFKDGKVHEPDYLAACYLLRDLHAKIGAFMDVRLLDLLCATQAWVRAAGGTSPLMITSGYRTRHTNARTEGASQNSLHIQGRAVDFHVDGVSPGLIASIASRFAAGGVGVYKSKHFLHLDTGNVRNWRG